MFQPLSLGTPNDGVPGLVQLRRLGYLCQVADHTELLKEGKYG